VIEHKHSNLLLKYPIKIEVLIFVVFTLQIKYEQAETRPLNLEICTVKLNIEIYFETRIRAENFKIVDIEINA